MLKLTIVTNISKLKLHQKCLVPQTDQSTCKVCKLKVIVVFPFLLKKPACHACYALPSSNFTKLPLLNNKTAQLCICPHGLFHTSHLLTALKMKTSSLCFFSSFGLTHRCDFLWSYRHPDETQSVCFIDGPVSLTHCRG